MAMSAVAKQELEELDRPEASDDHARKIRSKVFLRNIYSEHYQYFKQELKAVPPGPVVELGSGGGFIDDIIPGVITSDVVPLSTVKITFSALGLPFADSSLSGILMINVLHHIQDVSLFFKEASRCLKPGGKVVMVEPSNTFFGRFIYRNFHHEPFEPTQRDWQLPAGGRMSSANDALPWIVFRRDRKKFELEHPEFSISECKDFMPFRYLLSGGVSKPQLLPSWSYGALKFSEDLISPLHPLLGMFMKISLLKK